MVRRNSLFLLSIVVAIAFTLAAAPPAGAQVTTSCIPNPTQFRADSTRFASYVTNDARKAAELRTVASVVTACASGGVQRSLTDILAELQRIAAPRVDTVIRTVTVVQRDTLWCISGTTTCSTSGPPAPSPTPVPNPPPPTGGAHPNKPAHLRVIVDESFPWDVMVTGSDNTGKQAAMNNWGVEYSRGRMTVVANQDGPDSPPRALQWRYPAGLVVGEGVGDLYRSLPAVTNEIYVAFSLKHSTNFQWNGTSNKLFYLLPEGLLLQSRHYDRYLSIYQGSAPALANWTGMLANGRWYRIEYHVNAATRTARVYVDGALVNSGTISTSGNWSSLKFSSTYGGGGPTPTQDIFRHIDHVVIAVP